MLSDTTDYVDVTLHPDVRMELDGLAIEGSISGDPGNPSADWYPAELTEGGFRMLCGPLAPVGRQPAGSRHIFGRVLTGLEPRQPWFYGGAFRIEGGDPAEPSPPVTIGMPELDAALAPVLERLDDLEAGGGGGGGGAVIDDGAPALNKVWSSSKTDAEIDTGDAATLASALAAVLAARSPRVLSIASSGFPTVDWSLYEQVSITALAGNILGFISSNPVAGKPVRIRIKDNGVARIVNWGGSFMAGPAPLLASTSPGKTHLSTFVYDEVVAKLVCVASDLIGY